MKTNQINYEEANKRVCWKEIKPYLVNALMNTSGVIHEGEQSNDKIREAITKGSRYSLFDQTIFSSVLSLATEKYESEKMVSVNKNFKEFALNQGFPVELVKKSLKSAKEGLEDYVYNLKNDFKEAELFSQKFYNKSVSSLGRENVGRSLDSLFEDTIEIEKKQKNYLEQLGISEKLNFEKFSFDADNQSQNGAVAKANYKSDKRLCRGIATLSHFENKSGNKNSKQAKEIYLEKILKHLIYDKDVISVIIDTKRLLYEEKRKKPWLPDAELFNKSVSYIGGYSEYFTDGTKLDKENIYESFVNYETKRFKEGKLGFNKGFFFKDESFLKDGFKCLSLFSFLAKIGREKNVNYNLISQYEIKNNNSLINCTTDDFLMRNINVDEDGRRIYDLIIPSEKEINNTLKEFPRLLERYHSSDSEVKIKRKNRSDDSFL